MRRLRLVGWFLFATAWAFLIYLGIQLFEINNLHSYSLGQFDSISRGLMYVALVLGTAGGLIISITRIQKKLETKQPPSETELNISSK